MNKAHPILNLQTVLVAALAGGALMTALGLLAAWMPPFELFNHFRPLLLLGMVALLIAACFMWQPRLIATAAVIALVNLGLLVASLPGTAATSTAKSGRFLRVAAFNIWNHNQRLADVVSFLTETDADAIVLSELRIDRANELKPLLAHYPYRAGDRGIVILSKYPILAEGETVLPNRRHGRSFILRWARLSVEGTEIELAGVHLSSPFNPFSQVADTDILIELARNRTAPLIIAGDFNLTPWSESLKRFTRESGLGRANTFMPTWPIIVRLPLLAIDHIFVSPELSIIKFSGGPYVGSDHRPVIADIALSE